MIDELPDDQAALVEADVRRRLNKPNAEAAWPPAFFGIDDDKDGRTDVSEKVDEFLAEGFGSRH